MDKPTCKTCRFYVNRFCMTGDCRRHAPVVVDAHSMPDVSFQCSENIAFKWPMTRETDWCGDFEHAGQREAEISDSIRVVEYGSENTLWVRKNRIDSVRFLKGRIGGDCEYPVDVAIIKKKSGDSLVVYATPASVRLALNDFPLTNVDNSEK